LAISLHVTCTPQKKERKRACKKHRVQINHSSNNVGGGGSHDKFFLQAQKHDLHTTPLALGGCACIRKKMASQTNKQRVSI